MDSIAINKILPNPDQPRKYFDETALQDLAQSIKEHGIIEPLVLEQARWHDTWWTTRQAGDYHGVDVKVIYQQIKMGRIGGLHAVGKERRREQGWAYWYIRKSEAIRLVIPRGKGIKDWSPRADAFILESRAKGIEYGVIARMMKWPQKRVEYRYRLLKAMSEAGTTPQTVEG